MTPHHAERLSRTIRALRSTVLAILQHVDELSQLAEELEVSPGQASTPDGRSDAICRVDRRTFTVEWTDRTCSLGNTLPFRLMERLAQRSNQYVPVDRLMLDLWGGSRAPSTIRSAVSDLRMKLTAAGMTELAGLIDGSNPGHYGLIKKQALQEADALPTGVRRHSDSSRGPRR